MPARPWRLSAAPAGTPDRGKFRGFRRTDRHTGRDRLSQTGHDRQCSRIYPRHDLAPNPKLAPSELRAADLLLVVRPRLGGATTSGYHCRSRPIFEQILVHVHPDQTNTASIVPIADLRRHAGIRRAGCDFGGRRKSFPSQPGEQAHAWLEWSDPLPASAPWTQAKS